MNAETQTQPIAKENPPQLGHILSLDERYNAEIIRFCSEGWNIVLTRDDITIFDKEDKVHHWLHAFCTIFLTLGSSYVMNALLIANNANSLAGLTAASVSGFVFIISVVIWIVLTLKPKSSRYILRRKKEVKNQNPEEIE